MMTRKSRRVASLNPVSDKRTVKNPARQNSLLSSHPVRVLVIAVLSLLLYANTLSHDYTLDDKAIITKNTITQQGIHGIRELLIRSQYWGAIDRETKLYRPVPMVTHALEFEFFGMNPHVSHVINVLLYVLLCVLIYHLLFLWFGRKYPALPFIAALLFMAHPIHTEVVANIKGRDEILTLIFCTASAIFAFRFTKVKSVLSMVMSVLFFGLALFSKESALPFLAIIPLSLFFFSQTDVKRGFLIFSGLAFVTGCYFVARSGVLAGSNQYHFFRSYFQYSASPSESMATATGTFLDYLRLLIFPHPLVWSYAGHQIHMISWLNWKALVSLGLLVFFIFFGLALLPRKNILSFCMLFFLLSYVIVSNILIPISAVFAERFMFIPSLGFVIALSYIILKFSGLLHEPVLPVSPSMQTPKIIILILVSLLTTWFGVKTVSRNLSWKDDFTLFSHDIQYQPENVIANFFLAGEYVRKSIYAAEPEKKQYLGQAFFYLDRTVAIDSAFYEGYYLSGILLFHGNRYPEAISRFTKALRVNPDFSDTTYSAEKGYGYIATCHIRMNNYPAAIESYQKLVDFKPAGRSPDQYSRYAAYQNIGGLYSVMKQYQQSIPYLLKAIQIDSTAGITWQTLGFSYYNTSAYENAERCLSKAVGINNRDARSLYYLSLAARALGKGAEAGNYLRKAARLDPVYLGEAEKSGIEP